MTALTIAAQRGHIATVLTLLDFAALASAHGHIHPHHSDDATTFVSVIRSNDSTVSQVASKHSKNELALARDEAANLKTSALFTDFEKCIDDETTEKQEDQLDRIVTLVRSSAWYNINHETSSGMTPLLKAARTGRPHFIKKLIDETKKLSKEKHWSGMRRDESHFVNLNARSQKGKNRGETAFIVACKKGFTTAVQALLDSEDGSRLRAERDQVGFNG
jgi:ankyrin repeat protein